MGELATQIKGKVCANCGGKLKIKAITENSCFTDHKDSTQDRPVCEHCSKIEYGVEKEVFDLARKLVVEYGFKYYTHLNSKDDGEDYCIEANTGGAAKLAKAIISGEILLEEEQDNA